MQTIKLYKYSRDNGGVTVSPIKPECDYVECVRLVSDEGMVLTKDGINLTSCVDTDSTDGWYEVEAKEETSI